MRLVSLLCACQLPVLHLGLCLLEESPLVLSGWLVVCLTGVERQLSAPQVPWLRQRQPRVLRRKRDCTLPSSSQLPRVHLRRRCVLRRRKDCTQAFLFTTSACTSEEEGKALLPHKIGEFLGGGGTGLPPHNVGLYFGGGGTGLLPHNVGEYMQLVLRCVLSMSASRGVPALRMRLCWGNNASWFPGHRDAPGRELFRCKLG